MRLSLKNHTTIVVFLTSFSLYGQKINRFIFDSTRTYIYKATFIDKNNDTLTIEKIILQPLGIPWEFQKTQTKYEVTYYPTYSVVNNMKSPKSKKKKKWEGIKVSRKATSGAIEDSLSIWMHPFRSNQYLYTEICAFPYIDLTNLKVGEKWNGGTLFILSGWGNFKGKLKQTYVVKRQTSYNLKDLYIANCWLIEGVGYHNKLGKSEVQYIFNKNFGFLEFNYSFFDGTKITIQLKEIIDNNANNG